MKVIAFDLFGTVFDLSGVDRGEIRAYVDHIKQPEWKPLELPKSWERLPAFPDSLEGLKRLAEKFDVVTLSNAPLALQTSLRWREGMLPYCEVIALEHHEVFKPNPRAYMALCVQLKVDPPEVLMVTANKDFGDIEASRALGMEARLIRNPGCPQTIIELAESLGC